MHPWVRSPWCRGVARGVPHPLHPMPWPRQPLAPADAATRLRRRHDAVHDHELGVALRALQHDVRLGGRLGPRPEGDAVVPQVGAGLGRGAVLAAGHCVPEQPVDRALAIGRECGGGGGGGCRGFGDAGGDGNQERAKFGMGKFGAENIWPILPPHHHRKTWYRIPGLWHKNKRRWRLLLVISSFLAF